MVSPRKKSAAKSKSARPVHSRKPAKKAAPARGKTVAKKKPIPAKGKPAKASPATKASPAAKASPATKAAKATKAAPAAKPTKVAQVIPAAKPAKVVPAAKPAQSTKSIPIVRAVKVVPGKPQQMPPPGSKPPKRVAGAKGALGRNRSGPSPRKGSASEQVRPLGMLPPEAVARAAHQRRMARPPLKAPPAPAPVRPIAESNRTEGIHRVTEKDLKGFEEQLLQERRRILKEMGHLEATVLKVNQRESSGDLSGNSFHMADAGTDAMEREKAFLFASVEGRVLLQIDDALRRLYRGEYGNCETCGNPIARARLEVMPQARLCISCKEKEEREQRGAI